MSIAIEIAGEDAGVVQMLEALDTALNPASLAGFLADAVDPYLRGRAKDRFASEGDDVTGPWSPLAPATIEIRTQLGFSAGPINQRTQELIDYVTGTDGSASPQPFGATLTIPGTPPVGELADKLAHAQQGGTSDSGKTYPARPVLGMNQVDLMAVLVELARYIETTGNARIGA